MGRMGDDGTMSTPVDDAPEPALPALPEILETARVVSLPLSVRFRGVTHREAVLFRGPAGWGEFCPFLEYGPQESSRWLACAIEMAWREPPAPVRTTVPINATVPAVPPEQVAPVLARSHGRVREVKVKVAERGQSLAEDLARLRAVREAAPQAVIKTDANAGWIHEQALAALEAFEEFSPAYAEQPVAGIDGLARLRQEARRRGLSTPIAADESVRKETDPLEVARRGAADLIVVKAAPLGGVRAALRVIRQAGLPAVVSSALESSVGMAAGLALVAALPQLPHACGLGTASLYAEDLVENPLIPRDGELPVTRPAPEQHLLARHEVTGQRREWWLERTRAAYEALRARREAD